MKTETLKRAWYPLLPARALRGKPLATALFGRPLVLVRLNGQARCFEDCCPHRHVPLSEGKIVGHTLQCAYHGWRFDAEGKCCHTTGGLCADATADTDLRPFPCREEAGWLWVCLADNIPFALPPDFATPQGFETINDAKTISGDFIHAIENLLDPTHTPFIHAGLLRSPGRQRMHIRQSHDAQGFCTEYTLEDKQNGLINKLFDRGIRTNLARFTLPALACLDYLTPEKLVYRIAVFFIPKCPGTVGMSVRVHFPQSRLPLALKGLLFRPFLESLLLQDARIIRTQYRHHRRYCPDRPYASTENDLVIDHLLHLLVDNMPEGRDKSGVMEL